MDLADPEIIEAGPMTFVGFSFFGDPFQLSGGWTEENEIGRLWSRFMAYFANHHADIKHVKIKKVMYEVHVYHEETPVTGEFEVFVGVEVAKLEDIPVETTVKLFPPVTYAVFTLQGEQIVADWGKSIYEKWLPRSGYQGFYPYQFQRYDQHFKGLEAEQLAESVLEVYLPLKP